MTEKISIEVTENELATLQFPATPVKKTEHHTVKLINALIIALSQAHPDEACLLLETVPAYLTTFRAEILALREQNKKLKSELKPIRNNLVKLAG